MTKDLLLLIFASVGVFILAAIFVMYRISLFDTNEKPDPLEEYLKRVRRNSKKVK